MDPWVILPMERERHSQQFLSCQPTDGFITGTQVETLSFFQLKMDYSCDRKGGQDFGIISIAGQGVLHAGRLATHGASSGAF